MMNTLVLRRLWSSILPVLFFSCTFSSVLLAQPEGWISFSLGEPALQINLPVNVRPMESAVPGDMINHIQRFDTYRLYYDEGKVVAMFKFAQFNAPFESTVQEMMKKEMDEIIRTVKTEYQLLEEHEFKLAKIKGRSAEGSFVLDNRKWFFKEYFLRNENAFWQIWIGGLDEQSCSRIVDEIGDSFQF